jgi:hypothetical protein
MDEKKSLFSEGDEPKELFSSIDDEIALSHLDEMANNPDAPPSARAAARAMKLWMPLGFKWLHAERKAGTRAEDIFEGLLSAHISMILSAASTMGKDHESSLTIMKHVLFPMLVENMVKAIDSFEESDDLHAERDARERPH